MSFLPPDTARPPTEYTPQAANPRQADGIGGGTAPGSGVWDSIRDAIGGTANRLTGGANDLLGGHYGNIGMLYDLLGGNTINSQMETQRNQLLNQYGITQGYEDLTRSGLLTDAELARRGLGLDQAGLGVQRGAANRDLQSVAALLGINDQSLARNIGSVEQLLGLVWQGLGFEKEGIALNKQMQEQSLSDDATARGAYTAPGTRRNFSAIEKEAFLARQAANIGARQSEISLSDRVGSAREDHARTRISLNDRAGSANDVLKRLDIESQRLGLSADQISATLDQGLQRLGLDSLTNANDLITRLNGANVEQATMAANLLAQAAQLAGLEGIASIVGGGGTSSTSSSTPTSIRQAER